MESAMSIDQIAKAIASSASASRDGTSLLVAISGIDGSGKSTLAPRIVHRLNADGLHAVLIGLDAWHVPPEKRFSQEDPAQHFYDHAFRFEELFRLLLNPLKQSRSVHLSVELTRLPENDRFWHTYQLQDIDVVVVEGIFLLKRDLRDQFDLAFWVECSFETALQRALRRNQEGLSEEGMIRDFQTIYFPAQRLHLQYDDPKSSVDGFLDNNVADNVWPAPLASGS